MSGFWSAFFGDHSHYDWYQGESRSRDQSRSESSSNDHESPGFFSLLSGGTSENSELEQHHPTVVNQTSENSDDKCLPKIVNLGGGNERQTRKILEKISQEPGYGQDLSKIKEIRITNHLTYPFQGGIVPEGSNVHGYCNISDKVIYAETNWDLEDTIKHELGHAMKGYPEEYANQYAKKHY